MKLLDRQIVCKSRTDVFSLYPLGDLHIGARNCAEDHIRRLVKKIALNPKAFWIGGGDYCDFISPSDIRFDYNTLPDWILAGTAEKTRANLKDIASQQIERFCKIVKPIASQCLGLAEGNHERAIIKHSNIDVMAHLCKELKVPYLTGSRVYPAAIRAGQSD